MVQEQSLEYWEVWYPEAGATGVLLARGLMDPAWAILFHSAPDVVTVEVRDERGHRLAYGMELRRTLFSPMCRFSREGERVLREGCWPGESDLGSTVLLPGGEVGILKSWWHAADKKEWRWQVEFSNSLRSPESQPA